METTNEKTDFKGGNAAKQTARPCEKVSESEIISVCPECGGELRFGSRDPLEGDYWWCTACGYGPILFPLSGGPRRPVGIIDAETANAALSLRAAADAIEPGFNPRQWLEARGL